MTNDIFERRLRRDLDVIARSVTDMEPPPISAPAKFVRRPRHPFLRAGIAAGALTLALGAIGLLATDDDSSVTTGPASAICPVQADAAPAGTFVIGEGETGGSTWRVETTGMSTAPDVSIRSHINGRASGGEMHDASSWPAVINQGSMGWTYEITDRGTLVYGMLPPEVNAVRIDEREICAVGIEGEPIRYFAAALDEPPSQVDAVAADGSTVMTNTLANQSSTLPGTYGTTTDPAPGTVRLPIGGEGFEEPGAPFADTVLLAEGRTGELDWEFRASSAQVALVPLEGYSYDGARSPGYLWNLVNRDGASWIYGELPRGRVDAIKVRYDDGRLENVSVLALDDPSHAYDYFVAAAEGGALPLEVSIDFTDGNHELVSVQEQNEALARGSHSEDIYVDLD